MLLHFDGNLYATDAVIDVEANPTVFISALTLVNVTEVPPIDKTSPTHNPLAGCGSLSVDNTAEVIPAPVSAIANEAL